MREFNTRVTEGDYSITFETDDRKAFEQVQTLCRILIDGKDGDAIPIEWIKGYITPFQEFHDCLSEELQENDGAGWVVDVLETMLREWEKENEK